MAYIHKIFPFHFMVAICQLTAVDEEYPKVTNLVPGRSLTVPVGAIERGSPARLSVSERKNHE
jgi:hypothetical protein